MKYYLTKDKYDGYPILAKPSGKPYKITVGNFIKGELFTERELEILFKTKDFPRFFFYTIELSQALTFKSFGVRMICDGAIVNYNGKNYRKNNGRMVVI